MEEVYGAEAFAKTWEAWGDGIAQFAKRPEGTDHVWFPNQHAGEVKSENTFRYYQGSCGIDACKRLIMCNNCRFAVADEFRIEDI